MGYRFIILIGTTIFLIGCTPHNPSVGNDASADSSFEETISEIESRNLGNDDPMTDNNQLPPNFLISAEVVLVSATGKELTEGSIITSENINDYLPDPQTVDVVNQYFVDNQFDVLAVGGISISITAAHEIFSKQFDVTFQLSENGTIEISDASQNSLDAFQLDGLPEDIQSKIVSIILVPPPEFFDAEPSR